MFDITIEDFIHDTRSMQDNLSRNKPSGCLDDVIKEGALNAYLNNALTLARSYDKLLRELDVMNATKKPPTWPAPPWLPNTYGPIDNGFPTVPFVGDVLPSPGPLHVPGMGTHTHPTTNMPPASGDY